MSSSTSNPPESETPFGEAQLGQQINVLRRRVQNASFHGPAPRAIAVVVTTASRSRRRYLISPDLEAAERIGPERRGYGDVDRIAAPCHQHSPDPRHVVPWVEGIPASSEIRLEPSGEVHRTVGRRFAHVAEIAGAVPRRNVHASPKCNIKMCVIAADPAPLVERFRLFLWRGHAHSRMRCEATPLSFSR